MREWAVASAKEAAAFHHGAALHDLMISLNKRAAIKIIALTALDP
jgi:hypothetical protein